MIVPPTFGVEEEFLLVDPVSWLPNAVAAQVIEAVPGDFRPYVKHEIYAAQIEFATPVCHDLGDLREWLGQLRLVLAKAAQEVDARLLAVGWPPLNGRKASPIVEEPRYTRIADEVGMLVDGEVMSACHVHVQVDGRELAMAVSNHLRPWLPLLHALTANSPYAGSRDTGYASWRSVELTRWPTFGPAPELDSAEHYDRIVESLISSGVILDPRMVYWHARASATYPTMEVRAGDVCLTVDETVLVAALARALVQTAIADARADRPAPHIDDRVLAAAHWRAARDGLEGLAFDIETGRLRPVWELLDRLLERLSPVLTANGDLDEVAALTNKARSRGSGAYRQRSVFDLTEDMRDIPIWVAEQTLSGVPAGMTRAR